jgi:hypothetical protein
VRVPLLLLVAACRFQHGQGPGDGSIDDGNDGRVDMMIDMALDAFDAKCFGKAPFTICLTTEPTTSITLPQNINTSSTGSFSCEVQGGTIEKVSGGEACVFAGVNVTASGSIIGVFGDRPLVVIASNNLTVTTANFDVSSGSAGDGPDANPTVCAPALNMNGQSSPAAGGGGAGGSFGGRGGDGGAGALLSGGMAKQADITFDTLRGGCRGGTGAGSGGSANGGSGGGALYLIARNTLDITGTINASGAGGMGGRSMRGGGGGGGSGGMIVLHAGSLAISLGARLFANGGGGGGGAGTTTDGENGGEPAQPGQAAPGGAASNVGTAGGNGGFTSTAAETAANGAASGGGGGGGVGVIRILSGQIIASTNISPTPIN